MKKKIVFVIQSMNRLGGTEKATIDQANMLAKDPEYDVTILSIYKNVNGRYAVSPFISSNINVVYVYNKIELLKYSDIFYKFIDLMSKKQIFGIIKKISPDFCIFTSIKNFTYKGSWKSILMIHFSFEHLLTGKLTNSLLKKHYKDFYRIVFLSKGDCEQYEEYFNADNGCNINNYCMMAPIIRTNYNNKSIAYIGRLENEQKQINHALDIINILVQRGVFSGWTFNIYGYGKDEDVLKSMADKYNLAGIVYFKGVARDIECVYSSNDIIVLTSSYEGLPLCLIEGALSGLPLISYDCCPGISSIIDNNFNGRIIEKNNKLQFANELEKMILSGEDYLKVIGQNSLTKAINEFSLNVIKSNWDKLLELK
ncbi:glycosyltransferase [Klebsiella pneumoniae]|uniref:glycosyltransferase n=1 Tax=Klebsiella pneumoniae TaxID=573 RepID=UPI0027D2A6AF|nr:glycosyltransferase [Klebsiella pneumoniae]